MGKHKIWISHWWAISLELFPLQLGIGDWNLAPTRLQNNILNNKVPVSPLPNKCYGVDDHPSCKSIQVTT